MIGFYLVSLTRGLRRSESNSLLDPNTTYAGQQFDIIQEILGKHLHSRCVTTRPDFYLVPF